MILRIILVLLVLHTILLFTIFSLELKVVSVFVHLVSMRTQHLTNVCSVTQIVLHAMDNQTIVHHAILKQEPLFSWTEAFVFKIVQMDSMRMFLRINV